jgi:phosphoglycerate dehydrogenase-like enzyme
MASHLRAKRFEPLLINNHVIITLGEIMNVLVTQQKLLTKKDIEVLNDNEVNIFFGDIERNMNNPSIYDDVDFLVCGMEIINYNLDSFKNLKCIQLISSGYDYVDVKQLHDRNIMLCNAAGVYSIPIAEWVIATILMQYKKLLYFYDNFKNRQWINEYKLKELTTQKVLLFGTGSIGEEIAKRLKHFVLVLDGVNSTGKKVKLFDNSYTLMQAKSHLSEYDIIIFCLPSNEYTKGFVNVEFLNKLKNGALFINVGRGDLIIEVDLLDYAKEHNNNKFILDVVSNEPLSNESELWELSNVFISPHNSFASVDNSTRLSRLLTSNIIRFNKNESLNNVVLNK